MKIQRGELYTVNLIERDTTGAEIGKNRPGIVIQEDIWNSVLPTTIIVPLTSMPPRYNDPGTVSLQAGEAGLHTESTVIFPEIRSIDKSRLGKRLGEVSESKMVEIDRVLALILGLTPLD